MLLSFNVLLIQKYGWKTLIERNIYKANLISPVKRKIFFQIFFSLNGWNEIFRFFSLNIIVFQCLFNSKIWLESINRKKNYIKKN